MNTFLNNSEIVWAHQKWKQTPIRKKYPEKTKPVPILEVSTETKMREEAAKYRGHKCVCSRGMLDWFSRRPQAQTCGCVEGKIIIRLRPS